MSQTATGRGKRAPQTCPICGAVQPISARTCSNCGAALPGERTPIPPVRKVEAPTRRDVTARFDPAAGDDDLFAGSLAGRMWRLLLVSGVVLALAAGVGIGVLIGQGDSATGGSGLRVDNLTPGAPESTAPPTQPPRGTYVAVTLTPSPTREVILSLPTITPMPPTETATPTPGPCYQTAVSGDTVFGMAVRCGHKDLAVVDLILQINNMRSAQELQLGQTLEIPWPTPTGGPLPSETSAPVAGAGGLPAATETPPMVLNQFGTPDALAQYQNVEPTLRPGLAWHQVQAGDTIMGVAYLYDTSVETLSQINPEVPFRQCDYGERFGGQNCSVTLYVGQRLRVPVAIPTPTMTPTPYGTFTPLPTPTATFNAPYILAPEEGARFMSDQIVTLRWGGTGTLGPDQRYLIKVIDLEAGEEHQAVTRDTVYTLPGGWQPDDGRRHTFEWVIAVAQIDMQGAIVAEVEATDPRRFTWESR